MPEYFFIKTSLMLQNTLKGIFSIVAGTIILASCSSSKKSAVATASRDDVKGTWVLDNISYDGLPQGQKIKLT